MTRVLHLVTTLNRGGIEMWLLNMIRELHGTIFTLDVCCKGDELGVLATDAAAMGATVHQCTLRADHVRYAHCLSRLLRDGGYDILHNHLELHSGLPVWVAHRVGVPVITSFHNTSFPPQTRTTKRPGMRQLRGAYGRASIAYALRHSDVVTGCSKGVLQSLGLCEQDRGKGSTEVLYYGVDTVAEPTETERADFRASLSIPVESPLIVHVGRFVEQKNHHGILNVFQRVLAERSDGYLLLVGDGPMRRQVESEVTNRGLQDRVRFLGIRADAQWVMNLCDIFLFPSKHEGFGLAALEANAAGLPVVGSRIPGLMEAVEDGCTALLHALDDETGMAASVGSLLRDDSRRRQFALAGRARVERKFTTLQSAKRSAHLYDSLPMITRKGR